MKKKDYSGLALLKAETQEEKIKRLEKELQLEKQGRNNDMVFFEQELETMAKELLSYCKNKYDKLTLEVYSKNTKAINFYEREQFKIIKEYVEATNNEAELLMEWKKD